MAVGNRCVVRPFISSSLHGLGRTSDLPLHALRGLAFTRMPRRGDTAAGGKERLFSFTPGILEGDGAVEDGFRAGDVVFAVGDEIAIPLELAGVAGGFVK